MKILIIYVAILTIFAGYSTIVKSPSILFVPLLSWLNFVNGVVLIVAIFFLKYAQNYWSKGLGFFGVFFATFCAFGGYLTILRTTEVFKNKK